MHYFLVIRLFGINFCSMKIIIHFRAFGCKDVEIDISAPFARTPEQQEKLDEGFLEWIFRQFNRVNDAEFISYLGISVPSLSVGDSVEIDGRKYECAGVGWQRIS